MARHTRPVDDLIPSGDPDVAVFIVMMALGFLIGMVGHVYKSTTAIVIGIGLIFLATIGLPFVFYAGD